MAERDGLLTYRPSLPGRPTYRVTEDDAEAIAAEPSAAQRHRIAKERGLQGPVPRAKAVLVDAATGGPRKPGDMGAYSTGRYVATIDGQRIEVDPEDIITPTRSSPPTRGGLRFDYGAPAGYLAQARRQKKEASKAKPKRGRKKPKAKAPRCPPRAPGLRTTFKSSAEAAKLFYDGNALFFDHVRDPYDGLRDVFDGIEVRVGKRDKKLGHTPKGQAILQAQPADAICKTLQAIFGRTRSRRWDEVDWPLIERLGESLQPYFEPYDPSEPSRPGLYWRPFLGELDSDALAELDPDTLGQVADCESRRELGAALERLREVYAANRKCAAGCRTFASVGNATTKLVPTPTSLVTEIVPRCSFTMRRQMPSPNPVPPWTAFGVKRGSNTRGRTSSGIPNPSSSTVIQTCASRIRVRTATTWSLPGQASNALTTRLVTNCTSFPREPAMFGTSPSSSSSVARRRAPPWTIAHAASTISLTSTASGSSDFELDRLFNSRTIPPMR